MNTMNKHMNIWSNDSLKGYCVASYAVETAIEGRRLDEPFRTEVEYSIIRS